MIYYVFSCAPSSDLCFNDCSPSPIWTCYEISREKKKIYLIVRISCTLIQPIHSVIWYETPHQNFHQSPRFLVPIFWRSSVNYFIFATSQSDRVIMPAGFLFFSYPPKTTSAKPHQYERHKNHSRHSNITKRLPIGISARHNLLRRGRWNGERWAASDRTLFQRHTEWLPRRHYWIKIPRIIALTLIILRDLIRNFNFFIPLQSTLKTMIVLVPGQYGDLSSAGG